VHPDEFEQLFNTILINVTSFFRDKTAWDHLRDDILPHLLNIKSTSEPFRVWSAGCASGEEAYSLAMILAEHLGVEAFQAGKNLCHRYRSQGPRPGTPGHLYSR
jgi:two-component system CheB/CheR fusion protein